MVGRAKRNSEVVAIPNRYKNTLNNLIYNSDVKSLDQSRQIDKRLYNAPRSKGSSIRFLKKDCLSKNILNRLLQLMPKIRDF